jgi:hypothetical protein
MSAIHALIHVFPLGAKEKTHRPFALASGGGSFNLF